MEHLYFVCPATGREIDAGIATELETLLRIRGEKVRMHCPVCGQEHEWTVRDANLDAA
jgi:predicted RNA-binding Zn-ribbon protein involved in translation (DUF1610 family)